MTRYLLDTNVLIPLLWPRHTDQEKADTWFRAKAISAFATCDFTQAGFVRISSSAQITEEKFKLYEARELLAQLTKLPGHTFWPTDIDVFEATQPLLRRLHGPKQITDAYLLAIARKHKGKLATMDRAILSLAGAEGAHLVELIP